MRGIPALVDSARRSVYVLVLVMLVATLSLVGSFINRGLRGGLRCGSQQQRHGRHLYLGCLLRRERGIPFSTLPLFFPQCPPWPSGGRRIGCGTFLPYTTASLMVVQVFFIAVMAFMANPFTKLPFVPLDGEGINPLLTHFGMFFHPPALMAGPHRNERPLFLRPGFNGGR